MPRRAHIVCREWAQNVSTRDFTIKKTYKPIQSNFASDVNSRIGTKQNKHNKCQRILNRSTIQRLFLSRLSLFFLELGFALKGG